MSDIRSEGREVEARAGVERGARWPNLFIVGAVKAGTTSLYRYLNDHPDIYMSPVKEPDFFTKDDADEDAYLRLFERASGEKLLGEATPWYLARPKTPERIRSASPDAKIIIMLREPVRRAYSHYLMDIRNGDQSAPLKDAIEKDNRLPEHGYITLGSYCEQVARYLEVFGDQVHVVFFEEFVQDPRRNLERVLNFLGVDPGHARTVDLEVHNAYRRLRGPAGQATWLAYRNKTVRSVAQHLFPQRIRRRVRELIFSRRKPRMDPRVRAFLEQVYRGESACLSRLLGREVPWGDGAMHGERTGPAGIDRGGR